MRLHKIFNHLEESLMALLLAGMTLITFSQVIARYVFNSGAVWTLELTTYLFAWLVLLGMSYGVRVGAHIGIEVLVKLLPPLGQRIVAILAVLFSMSYCVLLLIGSWRYVSLIYTLGIDSEDLPVEQWIPYMILPLGFVLLFFRLVQALVKLWWGTEVRLLADEAQDVIKEHSQPQ